MEHAADQDQANKGDAKTCDLESGMIASVKPEYNIQQFQIIPSINNTTKL